LSYTFPKRIPTDTSPPSDGVIARRVVPVTAGAGRKLPDFESHQDVYPVPTGRFQFQTTSEGRGPDPSAAGQHTSAVHEEHGPC